MKKSKKGFTLIELLVAVLIIGILAAIAVPQYQVAIWKSKFATLKEKTRAIAEAQELYYLQNGKYASYSTELDLTFADATKDSRSFSFKDGTSCYMWNFSSQRAVACWLYINKVRTWYYNYFKYAEKSAGQRTCTTYSTNKSDITNKICQQETGKTANQASCSNKDGYCTYIY